MKIKTYSTKKDVIDDHKIQQMIDITNDYYSDLKDWKIQDHDLTKTFPSNKNHILSNQFIKTIETNKGDVIGYIAYGVNESTDSVGEVYISQIHVSKNYKRKGIGKHLLNSLFNKYKNYQFKAFGVFQRNIAGRKFWKSMGFDTVVYATLLRKKNV